MFDGIPRVTELRSVVPDCWVALDETQMAATMERLEWARSGRRRRRRHGRHHLVASTLSFSDSWLGALLHRRYSTFHWCSQPLHHTDWKHLKDKKRIER